MGSLGAKRQPNHHLTKSFDSNIKRDKDSTGGGRGTEYEIGHQQGAHSYTSNGKKVPSFSLFRQAKR